jgi:starch-binding outer membrane protein, SusD/RagB family
MNTNYFKILSTTLLAGLITVTSCVKDLDTVPIDPTVVTSATVYKDANAYRQVLAKCYAGLALTGQQGAAGNPDISGIDEGFSQYLRQYFCAQELTTDEAVMAWNDGTLRNYHEQNWTPAGEFITALYNRIYYQISLCNEFIRESTDVKLDSRGITSADKTTVQTYRAEARFLRALSYYHALDLFGNVPFVDETSEVGATLPKQITRQALFSYIESELLAIESSLNEPKTEYGRADKAAAWMLLGKLYLNASVYTGTAKYTECVTYVKKVIESGKYSLAPTYANMFKADNNTSPEMIFPIAFDGIHSKTWGGTTFLIHASVGGKMSNSDFGIDGGWGGLRTTSAFVDKFSDITGATDKRAMFFTDGQSKAIKDVFMFSDGFALKKWSNKTSTGTNGSDQVFTDTDFPVFRLADAYLMYAEAVVRGGAGGSLTDALTYINDIRTRAYGDASGNLASEADITLDFILDERARELYWEGTRRTDLIRFSKFSRSSYLWPWKGGVPEGKSLDDDHIDIFPIPSSDIGANPNLVQNTGYSN